MGELTTRQVHLSQFIEKEFCVFPLIGKIPSIKGWQLIKPNKDQDLFKLTGNYGVSLQEEDLVIVMLK